jgi:TetR/AcrR family acrAB operon transcriptional repressor
MAYRNDNSERAGAPPMVQARAPRQTSGGAATRERILASAERLFAERGFSGVSMPAIAAAAGITAGAIYKHFESKQQLFFQIVGRAVRAAPTVQEGEGLQGPARVARIVAQYATRRLKRVRQLAVEIHYAAGRDAKVRRLLRSSLDSDIAGMATRIAEAQANGEVDAALDPQLTASAIMTLVMGLMHGETLTPQLVGDAAWRDFIEGMVERLLAPR